MTILKTTRTISRASSILTSSSNMMMTSKQQQQSKKQKMNKRFTTTSTSSTSTTSVMRVRFNKSVKVKPTLHINNYTDEEIEACWFTSTEYNSIQKTIFMTLEMNRLLSSSSSTTHNNLFSNSNSVSSSASSSLSYCMMRGLENLSGDAREREQHQGLKESTRIRRRNAAVAVLDEQDRQYIQQYDESIREQGGEGSTLSSSSFIFVFDDIKIRNVSRKYTRISEDIAYSMGRIDATTAAQSSLSTTISTSSEKQQQGWKFNTTATTTTGGCSGHQHLRPVVVHHHQQSCGFPSHHCHHQQQCLC